jgi:cyclopropane fatty-acyl-phospholipid synthase-like methyltransferase
VFDLPTTKNFAEKTIEKFGLTERISFEGGDFEEDNLKGNYDVVWMSQVLHSMGAETCKNIIKKASSVLEKGGLIAIHEFILDESGCNPLFPDLFDLNMILGTHDGKSYTENELTEMLSEAGFSDIKPLAFKGPNDSGIITGIKA